jgi:hypothetical protein
MRKASFFIPLLFFNHLFSQPNFRNDTSYRSFGNWILPKIDSAFKLDKDNIFEYRVWILPALKRIKTLFILSLKNDKWQIRSFNYGWRPVTESSLEFFLEESKSKNEDLRVLINEIGQNNYLDIPDGDSLKDRRGEIADAGVLDGESYCFELISKRSKRSYFYHCPGYNAKAYNYIKEFQQVINIIKALYRFYGIKDYRVC